MPPGHARMSPAPGRRLDWEGCFNARDLGGLRTRAGGRTVSGRIVRADALDGLTAGGWAALVEHGVRTVVDLREPQERGSIATRPPSLRTVHVPLDGSDDREFWSVWRDGPQFGTPLYYRPHLERMPERSAAALAAIARAGPGGVAFHCQGGRDRTGQITMLLLALVDVAVEEIVADYELSRDGVAAMRSARGEEDEGPEAAAHLHALGTSAAELIAATLAELDVEPRMLDAGLTTADLEALRGRLLEPERGA